MAIYDQLSRNNRMRDALDGLLERKWVGVR